ncbi:class I SAM-dependent methyltransferase [Streptomyces sp. NPDC006307]|uniref:class I SAM-dependent methyltransferase n=1 Tax=Streptomyces sp. NPDC006307 TaxID=3156748 RepID=UPI00339DEE4D
MDGHTWRELDPSHPRYGDIFRTYLAHTDEKEHQQRLLYAIVDELPQRDVFVDAGAGTGLFTAGLAERFDRTVAVEPDPALRRELRTACPDAEVLPVPIAAAEPAGPADLVLCSHVLYYVPEADWPGHVARMLSWLRPGGELVLVLQHPHNACMAMVRHFGGPTRSLNALLPYLDGAADRSYRAELVRQRASVRVPDLPTALEVCQLVVGPLENPSARTAVADYLHTHCAEPGGGFALSCDQDFLRIRRDA